MQPSKLEPLHCTSRKPLNPSLIWLFRTAAKGLKHAIHTLRKQIQDLNGSIQEQEQRLADLSVEVGPRFGPELDLACSHDTDRFQIDNRIAQHVDLAIRAVQDAIPATATQDSDAFEGYKADLASLSSSRAAVASAVKRLYLTLDERYASFPSAAELQHDAQILDAKLRGLAKDKSASQNLLQVAYIDELEKMARELEAGSATPDTLANVIRSPDAPPGSKEVETSAPNLKVDVKGELERAGRMDRLVLLKAQERGLDAVRLPAHASHTSPLTSVLIRP